MNAPSPPLERFVRAVHRRRLALRALEQAGLGLLVGCVAAAVLVGVLLWRGQDAWGVAGTLMAAGTVVGAMSALANRPTPLAAAAEADRQLATADLLATAWALRDGTTGARGADPFRETVVALATARCRTLSPSAVLLRRLGGRAWGGIALAVAFVTTLAALSDRAPRAAAAADGAPSGRARADARDVARRPILEITAGDARFPRRVEQNPGEERTLGDAPPVAETPLEGADGRGTESDAAASGLSPGTGSGAARGDPPEPSAARPSVSSPGGDAALPRSRDGQASGGVGRAADNPLSSQVSGGGAVGGPSAAPGERAWTAAEWRDAVDAARQAVQTGAVPGEYRDLVRGYFDPVDLAPRGGRD